VITTLSLIVVFFLSDDRKILDSKMEKLAKVRSKEMARLKSEQAANALKPAQTKRRLNTETFYGKSSNAAVLSKKKKKDEGQKMSEVCLLICTVFAKPLDISYYSTLKKWLSI